MQQQSEIVSKLLLLIRKPNLLVCCSCLIHASVNKTCHFYKPMCFFLYWNVKQPTGHSLCFLKQLHTKHPLFWSEGMNKRWMMRYYGTGHYCRTATRGRHCVTASRAFFRVTMFSFQYFSLLTFCSIYTKKKNLCPAEIFVFFLTKLLFSWHECKGKWNKWRGTLTINYLIWFKCF